MAIVSASIDLEPDEEIIPMGQGPFVSNLNDRTAWASRGRLTAAILALGLIVTAVCLAGEFWLVFRLLEILPDGSVDPVEIQRVADIGKWIAGATGATLVVRWLLDRSARRARIGITRAFVLFTVWVGLSAAIYQSLQIVTDAIVDSLPAEARHDAAMIALYRKNVQDGKIGDPDFFPASGGTLSDLQRVKAANAAIGLLDRERDYARRTETAFRDATEIQKAQIVAQGRQQSDLLRARIEAIAAPFLMLERVPDSATGPAQTAWSAYSQMWSALTAVRAQAEAPSEAASLSDFARHFLTSPPDDASARVLRDRLIEVFDLELLPAIPELGVENLRLGDVPPELAPAAFGHYVGDALAARRDSALWRTEDRVLGALEAVNLTMPEALPSDTQRKLVMSVVVPPLALSFGMIGIIANSTALVLLCTAFAAALLRLRHAPRNRGLRTASVVLPWIVVAGVIFAAPPVPFSDGQGFSRIAQQAAAEPNGQVWTNLWLRMIGIEAVLVGE
jgi:hypothetical protein